MLRAMTKSDRNDVLEYLGRHNPEMATRVRELLYVFEDLQSVSDRSLQKLLGEVDTTTLATSLTSAEESIVNKVLSNMSKRARESLSEEMELMVNVPEADREAARKTIVATIQRLDQDGELVME
jgi:flagellar motor switch protein FliG